MNALFNPNNGFFRTLSWLVDVIGISLLWILLCLPVVTILPAAAALYHTAALCVRKWEVGAFTRFLRSFRQNLRQGCLLTVPAAVLGLVLFLGHNVMASAALEIGGYATVLYGVYCVLLLVPLGALCWLGPLLGRFEFSSRELCRTALLLALRHLPATVFAVAVTMAAALACFLCFPLVLLLPVIAAMLISLPMERAFRRYLPEEG